MSQLKQQALADDFVKDILDRDPEPEDYPPVEKMGVELTKDDFSEILFDHDCHASPDDGCSTCELLGRYSICERCNEILLIKRYRTDICSFCEQYLESLRDTQHEAF